MTLLEVLEAIDAGTESVIFNGDDAVDRWCDDVPYRTEPSGWQIVVFFDCGDWDYVDRAITPDGYVLDFDTDETCRTWRPKHPGCWTADVPELYPVDG